MILNLQLCAMPPCESKILRGNNQRVCHSPAYVTRRQTGGSDKNTTSTYHPSNAFCTALDERVFARIGWSDAEMTTRKMPSMGDASMSAHAP